MGYKLTIEIDGSTSGLDHEDGSPDADKYGNVLQEITDTIKQGEPIYQVIEDGNCCKVPIRDADGNRCGFWWLRYED